MPQIPLHVQFRSLADAEMRHRHQRAQPMSMTTDRKRTIEARLDKLRQRLNKDMQHANPNLVAVLKGTLDLLADVLLEDDHG